MSNLLTEDGEVLRGHRQEHPMSQLQTLDMTTDVPTAECATCGEKAVRSPYDASIWVHLPTRDAGWALPGHRVVRAR
jgi:hypothetical protein